MLLHKIKIYLKLNFPNPSIDSKWTGEDNKKIFSHIHENFPELDMSSEDNQLEVKHAFKEHFESVGYLLFKISKDQIRLKVFPYKIEPKDSINLEEINNILNANEHLIQNDYNGKEDLICIQKELTMLLNHFVTSIDNEEINKRELLKYGVRHAFELHPSDIIIIKNNQIFIKLFDDKNIQKVPEDQKNTVANRYNGINEESLKSFYKDFFIKENNVDFFYFVAEEFVNIYLIDKKMNNATYEQYASSLIQTIVKEHLVEDFDHSEEFFKGFSGYVFRIHFNDVFDHIADIILAKISESNKELTNFLKYYSLNVLVIQGKKYKVPEIEAGNGLKWNVASIVSIVKIYIKAEMSLETMRESINALEQEVEELYVDGRSPVEYNRGINKEIIQIEQEITYEMNRLNKYINELDSFKNEDDRSELIDDIQDIKIEIKLLEEERDKLSTKLVDRSVIINYTNLRREVDSITSQDRRKEAVLSQNRDAYVSIKKSLIKALTSKKVLIEQIK